MSELPPINPPDQEKAPVPNAKEVMDRLIHTIEDRGVLVTPDRAVGAYRLSFESEGATTTIRIILEDYCGADIVITNMTTLPEDKVGQGYGSKALATLISWAYEHSLNDIRATQVAKHNVDFWLKNNFTRCEGENSTSDFVYNAQ